MENKLGIVIIFGENVLITDPSGLTATIMG